MKPGSWLEDERAGLATERILDAAASVFVEEGVAGATMEEVARAAGCSRATVYRYFEDRESLRRAFVHRETRRVGAKVAAAVAGIEDPATRIVEAIMQAVSEVRSRPTLLAWFASSNAELTREVVDKSPIIFGMAAGLFVDDDDSERAYRALWLVRTVISLIVMPGADEAEERALLGRFVGPVLAAPGQTTGLG